MEAVLADFYRSELVFGTVVVRLLVAAGLGMVVGLDREIRNQAAGLRTHMLVAVASATFIMIALEVVERAGQDGSVQVDPTRVIEAVTAGIAFLAAGAIIQARGEVRGITTGAGLWLAGALGTAAGVGAFVIAITATVIGFVILALLGRVEAYLPREGDDAGKPDAASEERGDRPSRS